MQTWTVLQIFRTEARISSRVLHSSSASLRRWRLPHRAYGSGPAAVSPELTQEQQPISDDPANHPKLKGKARWRARRRALREGIVEDDLDNTSNPGKEDISVEQVSNTDAKYRSRGKAPSPATLQWRSRRERLRAELKDDLGSEALQRAETLHFVSKMAAGSKSVNAAQSSDTIIDDGRTCPGCGRQFESMHDLKLHRYLNQECSRTRQPASTSSDSKMSSSPLQTPPVSVPAELPKPSFLRPSLQDRLREKLVTEHNIRPRARGTHPYPSGKTLKQSLESEPFQTAFSQNPYAHALASPVREDNISRVHLPSSCMLDFRVAELESEPTSDEAQASAATVSTRPNTKLDKEVQYQLLPLSMAAELMPKKKRSSTQSASDAAVSTTTDEHGSYQPSGIASHVTATYDALSFISADTKRRLIPFALSRRTLTHVSAKPGVHPTQIKWRPDMPDFVLGAMRRIVEKKLGYLLSSKGKRDKPGLVSEVLGGGQDIERLHQMEDVSCVIQLDGDRSLSGAEAGIQGVTAPNFKWYSYPFLNDVSPLPSSQAHSERLSRIFATIPYRNTRVPVYSLPALLGEERARKLVAQTVFAEGGRTGKEQEMSTSGKTFTKRPTKFVVLTRSNGTIPAQIWLLKLQGYVGDLSKTVQVGSLPQAVAKDDKQIER